MPIPLPNLDDRTYDDLISEARALIPSLYPPWTNHNPTDPGLVLLELLAWLTEMVLYQIDEIPEENIRVFLGLLNESGWSASAYPDLDTAIRRTVLDLRARHRAVTAADYEHLAQLQAPQKEQIRRARAIPRRNLTLAQDDPAYFLEAPAHLSLVVVPHAPGEASPQPSADLLEGLEEFLEERRLLTTRHHVIGPVYLPIEVSATIYLREDAPPETALCQAKARLEQFFHPLIGGPEQTGWPFGRNVNASEVYAELEKISLIDFVEVVDLTAPGNPDREQRDGEDEEVVSLMLDAPELVVLSIGNLIAKDAYKSTELNDVQCPEDK